MSIKSVNPQYSLFVDDQRLVRDAYKGERRIKAERELYLPATPSMHLDNMSEGKPGRKAYDAYLLRAVFPDYVKEAVELMIGIMHKKPATIELPAAMEPLREAATVKGESLQLLLRRINEQQLVAGRVGIMADLPAVVNAAVLPAISVYEAETIINWDDGGLSKDKFINLNMVVLDETAPVRTDVFNWEVQERYRVLMLGLDAENEATGEAATYKQGVFTQQSYSPANMEAPLWRGVALDQIPFVFINSKDVVADIDEPPLLGLARLCLAMYRTEADYRQNLFMQGQDTLVIIGGVRNPDGIAGEDDDAVRVGAGARIDVEVTGDAKYIGVSSDGLSEQRECLTMDQKRAEHKSGQLITSQSSGNPESGEALNIRIGAQTATLNQLAVTGAAGLERLLRIIAVWGGYNPEEVRVIPNTDFTDVATSGKTIVELVTARNGGAPISLETIHKNMVDSKLTNLTFEEEMDLIEQEMPANPPRGAEAPEDGEDE